jgi:shikimate dehydrogenase
MSSPVLRYAVIGDPIEHSLSPQLFSLLFETCAPTTSSLYSYQAQRVPASELSDFVQFVRKTPSALSGFSVTLPHKVAICSLLDRLATSASIPGAVNCVERSESGLLIGHNTDAAGLLSALQRTRWPFENTNALVLGAGGAARAAVSTLVALKVDKVTIANRSMDSARALIEALRPHAEPSSVQLEAIPLAEVSQLNAREFSHLINATSVGLSAPEDDPLPQEFKLEPQHHVVDLVYRPLRTALLRRAEKAGANKLDGLWMLIEQALWQLDLWTGLKPASDVRRQAHLLLSREI